MFLKGSNSIWVFFLRNFPFQRLFDFIFLPTNGPINNLILDFKNPHCLEISDLNGLHASILAKLTYLRLQENN